MKNRSDSNDTELVFHVSLFLVTFCGMKSPVKKVQKFLLNKQESYKADRLTVLVTCKLVHKSVSLFLCVENDKTI